MHQHLCNRWRIEVQFVTPFRARTRLENARDISVPPKLAQSVQRSSLPDEHERYRPTLNVILTNSRLILCCLCAPAMRTLFLPFASPLTLSFPSSLNFWNWRRSLGALSQEDFGFADPDFRRVRPHLASLSTRTWLGSTHSTGGGRLFLPKLTLSAAAAAPPPLPTSRCFADDQPFGISVVKPDAEPSHGFDQPREETQG